MSYQKPNNLDKNLIFSEYFNSEQEVRRNGTIPTATTFTNGKAVLSGVNSWLEITGLATPYTASDYSVRIRVKMTNFGASQIVFDLRGSASGTGYLSTVTSPNRLSLSGFSTADTYLNGVNQGTLTFEVNGGEWLDIVCTNIDFNTIGNIRLGSNYADAGEAPCEIELFEIYNKILTAEEVSNLYNDARYVVPSLNKEVQGNGTDENYSICINESYTSFLDVSRTGFRVVGDGSGTHIAGTNDQVSFIDGSKLLIRFNLTLNSGLVPTLNLSNAIGSTTARAYEGQQVCEEGWNEMILTPNITLVGVVQFRNFSTATDYTISDLSVQQVAVQQTKEILNVNAFSGVARNELSGDSANNGDLLGGQNMDFTTGWGDFNTPILTANSITSTSTAAQGVYYNAIMTIGKRYALTVKGNVSIPTPGGSQVFEVFEGFSTRRTVLQQNTSGEVSVYDEFVATYDEIYLRCDNATGIAFVATEVSLIEIIPEVTNTDVEVVKEGHVRVPRFNGSTSKIDCGSYHDLTGDITVMAWHNPLNRGKALSGRIIDNGKFKVFLTSSNRFIVTSDGTTLVTSNTALEFKLFNFVTVVRKASGLCTIYWNGNIASTVDLNSGTPVAGTTNIGIGSDIATLATWNGELPEVRIIEGLLTPEEISAYYTATKHLYGK